MAIKINTSLTIMEDDWKLLKLKATLDGVYPGDIISEWINEKIDKSKLKEEIDNVHERI